MKKKKKATKTEANDLVLSTDHHRRFRFWMLLFSFALLATAAVLAVNYLIFIPWTNKQKGLEEKLIWNNNTIFAFVLVMVLLALGIIYGILYFWFSLKHKYNDPNQKKAVIAASGFTAGFTDTIGIGSFGIMTGLLKVSKSLKDDSKLPGTLNVALGLAALVESALFVGSIEVDIATLMILLASLIVGVVVGSFFVSRIHNGQIVKLVMGIALTIVGVVMILTHPQVNVINTTNIGDKTSLMDKPWRIVVAVILFFFFGAIQAFGIGLYAPAMASLSLLGLRTEAIFPIMACGSALSMLPASVSFIKRRNYLQLTSNITLIASIFGVIASFLLVFVGLQMGAGMDKDTFDIVLKWLAVVVIFYVAISMLVDYGLNQQKINQEKKQSRK